MLIQTNPEPKEPKYDTKAGRQIFDKEHTRENSPQTIPIPKDSENPVDIKLRQLMLLGADKLDPKVFIGKWAVVVVGGLKDLRIVKGRIKSLFYTRDIYIRTRKGEDIIVPFDKVMEFALEREPA